MDSRKFSQKPSDTDPEEIDRIRRESELALKVVSPYRYTAMRQYYFRVWPEKGEIRTELNKLKAMPTFERDELMQRAGFSTQNEFDQWQEMKAALMARE